MTFFKNDRGPHGMPKQVFLARFELVVPVGPVLALLKSQNALKRGYFGPKRGQQWVKNGSKMGQKWVKNVFFRKMILDHLGCLDK